jgi:fibronectin type 3 domain-containing protein
LPLTIAAGQTATFTLKYTPQATGSSSGTVSFVTNAAGSPLTESMTGTGTAPPQHHVDLSWTPSTSSVSGYNVYRSATSGSGYVKINSSLNANTAYTDNSVQAGSTYFYVTTAVDSSGTESSFSNQVQAVIPTP